MRKLGACLALTTIAATAAWAHPGHGAALPHLHGAEGWSWLALAAVVLWLVARSGRR